MQLGKHGLRSAGHLSAIGTAALCMLLTFCTEASGQQVCFPGPSSQDADGFGNNMAKAQLPAFQAADACSDYVSALGIATGYEAALQEAGIIVLGTACADNPETLYETIGPLTFDGDNETFVLSAPTGGWTTLSGTYDDFIITSIGNAGSATGAMTPEVVLRALTVSVMHAHGTCRADISAHNCASILCIMLLLALMLCRGRVSLNALINLSVLLLAGQEWTFTCPAGEVIIAFAAYGTNNCGLQAINFYCGAGGNNGKDISTHALA